jgi:hypothetical protein
MGGGFPKRSWPSMKWAEEVWARQHDRDTLRVYECPAQPGFWHLGHAQGLFAPLAQNPNVQLVAVVEPDMALAQRYAAKFHSDFKLFYTDTERMLDQQHPDDGIRLSLVRMCLGLSLLGLAEGRVFIVSIRRRPISYFNSFSWSTCA